MTQRSHLPALACLLLAAVIAAAASAPMRADAAGAGAQTAMLSPAAAAPEVAPEAACRAATARAEAARRIPDRLLSAIALAESGRKIAGQPELLAWPWTVMAEGRGRYLPSKDAAIAEVEALQSRGVRNIDVGCMQINLHFHPDAFEDLEEAFDPVANAAYAADFLVGLRTQRSSWIMAVGAYHSNTRSLGTAYRQRVFRHWNDEKLRAVKERRAALPDARAGAAPSSRR